MTDNEERDGLWFEDPPAATDRSSNGRRVGVVVASIVCVAALAVPVAFALSSNGPSATHTQTAPHLTRGVAEQQVLSALSATTTSGSFNVSYEFDPLTPPTVSTTTTTVPSCHIVTVWTPNSGTSGAGQSAPPPSTSQTVECPGTASPGLSSPTTGQGTIDTDPFAMVAVSNVPGLGVITLRDNGTDVWEFGGGNYGLAPGSQESGPGASLSGFAGLVEGTLGARSGALAMGGLASPTGYLDLDQSMITGADQTGTGTVDGVPVTVYEISIDPAQGADVPGINAEEAKAITDAAALLKQQGYTGTTTQVSVDASGYIRQTRSVAHFSDGSTSTSEATFSDFGCAGTVLMPGQTGPTTPPAGCVSPDTGVAAATASTVPSSSTTTSSTVPSTTLPSTTLPPTTTTSATEPSTSSTTTSTSTTQSTPTTGQGVTTPTG
jgi:hypothetical protein